MQFRWRLRHKFTAGLLLVLGMTGLLAAGAYSGLSSYRQSNRIFNYHQNQLEILGYLEIAVGGLNWPGRESLPPRTTPEEAKKAKLDRLLRIETMMRNYREGLDQAIDGAFSTEGIAQQFAEIDTMEAKLNQLKASVSGIHEHPRVAANDPSPNWFTKSDVETIAQFVTAVERLRGHVHTEVTKHVEADRRSYSSSLAVVVSATVLVLALMIVFVWLGYRSVFHPLQQLHRGVTKLAGGNFASRVKVETGDEMEELGHEFNAMADKLEEIYHDLNRKVEDRSRQLIRSERLASVGFLAAGVAHEINNPLASIAFCGEALDTRIQKLLPKTGEDADVIRSYLQMIQEEAFRCKDITEKLLDFSRAGSESERVETDMVALVRSVLEMVQHLGRAKEKHLVFQPIDAVMARINPQEIKQVLLNLVINGLDSTDEGGTVAIEVSEEGDDVELTVKDNGCGMTDEVLANLFEPFFTRNRTGKGTGLGLSISHLIVSQHGGSLDAWSAGRGAGSTFTVRLPAMSRQLAAVAA